MAGSSAHNTPRKGIFGVLRAERERRAAMARMEAFLSSAPGAWCGWAEDGTLVYNETFCALLGLKIVRTLSDIQNALSPSDAAVLEGLFLTLQDEGKSFSVNVRAADQTRGLKLTGARGRDMEGSVRYDILWLEDDTAAQDSLKQTNVARTLAESERDRLQSVLDRLPLPVWLRDARTDLVWCNRAYAQALDTTPASVVADQRELPAKTATGRKGAGKAVGKALAQGALDSGGTEQAQAYAVLGGRRRLMAVSETAVPALRLTLGTAQDITREDELETEQKRYTAAHNELLEHLGAAIGIFDGEQKLEFYNAAFAQLWKLEDKYLNTRPKLGDLMEKMREGRQLPEQADFRKYKQGWLKMFTSLLGPHEEMLYLPNGSALRMLAVPHPMGGLMMTFEDVSSRLELESSYNTLIAVQKETLDNLAEGVAVFGGDGRLKLWNPSFATLWGFNPEDLDGTPHVTRLSEKMRARFKEEDGPKWQKIIVAQSIDRMAHDGRMEQKDGTLIQYSTVPLPDGGVLVTHVDITDKVRAENALREKNAALEAAERLKLDFLANVSYQLRTPLSTLMGFTEILSNEYFGKLNERQKEYTSGMQEAGERLLALIDDILDLSTIEAGYMHLEKTEIPVKAMLDSLTNLTRDWARRENTEVRIDCAKDAGSVHADERRLKQALLNLLRNAITWSPTGSVITLGARREGGAVRLSVADSGPGIAAADQKRIFEPFARAQNPEKRISDRSGAGLGLALVRNIVQALHGGKVELDSAPGRGAVFTIVLPVS